MNEDDVEKARGLSGGGKQGRAGPYTAKDFQFEVLGQLAEVQALTEALQESVADDLKKGREQNNLLQFDGRTLVAVGAIALSLTGYVLQDARNTSKRDSEIETMKARVVRLEQIEATNTEGRIRSEVELRELQEGQVEIKTKIQPRSSTGKKAMPDPAGVAEPTREHGRE